jgi:hypothetical protein
VDDREFDGLDAEALKELQPDGPIVSFLADEVTLTNADHPVLAVWALPTLTATDGTPAVPEDGVYRGL